jgi:hypothetical protein
VWCYLLFAVDTHFDSNTETPEVLSSKYAKEQPVFGHKLKLNHCVRNEVSVSYSYNRVAVNQFY